MSDTETNELRALCRELGLNKRSSGQTVDELIEVADEFEDPAAWLESRAKTLSIAAERGEENHDTEAAEEQTPEETLPPDASRLAPSPDTPIVLNLVASAVPEGVHLAGHVEVGWLKSRERQALRALREGMRGSEMYDGRLVQTNPDLFRHLLNLVADQMGLE